LVALGGGTKPPSLHGYRDRVCDDELVVWDVASGRELARTTVPGWLVNGGKMAVSTDGRTLATVTRPRGITRGWCRLTVRDLPGATERFTRELPDGNPMMTPDGAALSLSPTGDTVLVPTVRAVAPALRSWADRIGLARLLPDDQPGGELFSTDTGRELGFVRLGAGEAHWSADGTMLATMSAEDDGVVTVWDIPPRKSLAWFLPSAAVLAVLFGVAGRVRARRLAVTTT
jgi:hypothetical protein